MSMMQSSTSPFPKDRKETLEQEDQEDMTVNLELKVRRVTREIQETPAHRVPKVKEAHRVREDREDIRVRLALKEKQVLKDLRESLERRVIRETKVMQALPPQSL
jgi:hypothetical protein